MYRPEFYLPREIFDESRLNQLRVFGLTHLQAKVYVSIYLLEQASIRKIVDLCQMHKVEVYRVLRELEKLGAVDRIISYPVEYRVRRPEEVLKNLLLVHVKRLAELGDLKMDILEWFHSLKMGKQDGREDDDGSFVLRKMAETIDRASEEILYISSAYEEVLKSEVLNAFYRALERRVKARGILNVTMQDLEVAKQLRKSPQVLRRHSDEVYSWMVIVDGREILFSSAPRALPEEEFLYTRNQRFIGHAVRSFELLFQGSIPIEERIQQLEGVSGIGNVKPECVVTS